MVKHYCDFCGKEFDGNVLRDYTVPIIDKDNKGCYDVKKIDICYRCERELGAFVYNNYYWNKNKGE